MPTSDLKYSSPAALRNREPISTVLETTLPSQGIVLEIASGSGEHVIHFAAKFPDLTWQPSDPSAEARTSIEAWRAELDLINLRPPLELDTTAKAWPIEKADAIIAINMVHISPWQATLGLLQKARELLPSGGILLLYGPYRQEGRPFEPSNADFDASLRSRNPAWGIRKLEDVIQAAASNGLAVTSTTDMPANNLCVTFQKR